MADEIDNASSAFKRAFGAILKKGPDKSATAVAAREKQEGKKADQRRNRRTGRTYLWGLRTREGLKEECQQIAEELSAARGKSMPVAEWVETVLEEAIARHRQEKRK